MDNRLTPNKIQRLMHLAEDKSFHSAQRGKTKKEDTKSSTTQSQVTFNKTGTNYESSLGILDLENIEVFGESGLTSMSLSKSNVFNPGEMTGRSTGTEDMSLNPDTRAFDEYGKHSVAIENITSHMDKQTLEIKDIMRHSIATNYSFHSKRDLTADEASLVIREACLPVQNSTQLNFPESMLSNANMSVGAYFKNRCPEFGKILSNVDSPNRPSITEVSQTPLDVSKKNLNDTYKMDQTLDCVPVRQPRANNEKILEKSVVTNLFNTKKETATFIAPKTQIMDNSILPTKGPTNMSVKTLNQSSSQKPFNSSNPTDVLLRNLQSSMRLVSDETECSTENLLSISKIADYLGNQSNVGVSQTMTDMLEMNKKRHNTKRPLTELHMNQLENKTNNQEMFVANLKDTKRADTASSSGSVNTVMSKEKLNINDKKQLPLVIVTRHSLDAQRSETEDIKYHRVERSNSTSTKRSNSPSNKRSNSPSSRSWSTASTVQENVMSFKSVDSPHTGKGQSSPQISSPNVEYKELDKSVDWRDVLQQKYEREGLDQEKWAEIIVKPVNGFVGVGIPVTISVTTLTNSWLTAKFESDNLTNIKKYITVELPRLPLLLSPGKTEKFTLHITSNVEMDDRLPFTMYLTDASIDGDLEQKGHLEINIRMPTIQAISCDGVNKLTFPTMSENLSMTKYFVLISDCPVDLQMELLITEGDSLFVIKSLQEIKKNDVSKALMEPQNSTEDAPRTKAKGKGINKQLCRLSSGDAIKVAITFNSPKLSDLEISEKMVTFKGTLSVNLIGINTLLKKVTLMASVGRADLAVPTTKLTITNETTIINLYNTGPIPGVWTIKFRGTSTDGTFPFKVYATRIEIRPGSNKELILMYTGSPDSFNEGSLVFEDISNGNLTTIDITGGQEKPKIFPIKTNYNIMSWVRAERKEVSLKNSTNKKVQIRCQLVGDGFQIDSPGVETRGTFVLSFGPCECRPLPIIFTPKSSLVYTATLHLVFDKSSEFSRKIKLHGTTSGGCVRWSALLTYGDTALVQARATEPLHLTLYNKGHAPAFISASVRFSLQYRSMSSEAVLVGGRSVVRGRGSHVVSLRLPWSRLQRRVRPGAALAALTVLTGPDLTRRRILRILRNETTGELDMSLLPDHLHVLAEPFENEDPAMEKLLGNFSETKASLNELIEDLQELSAKIDLPQEFPEDNTIVLTDDTVVEHHTLCD